MHSISNCATKSLVRFRLQKSTPCTAMLCQINKIMPHFIRLHRTWCIVLKPGPKDWDQTEDFFTREKQRYTLPSPPPLKRLPTKMTHLTACLRNQKYLKVAKRTRNYQDLEESTRNGQRLSEFSKKYQKMQRCARNHYKVPEISRKHQKFQESTRNYKKGP